MTSIPDDEITGIKQATFDVLKTSRHVWIIEERGAEFIVHKWRGPESSFGPSVGPQSSYPTLRKAAARLLQILSTGPVAPQTWPEEACIGEITTDD